MKHTSPLLGILLMLSCFLLYFYNSSMVVYFSDSVFPLADIHQFRGFIYTSIYRYLIGLVGCFIFLLLATTLTLSEENLLVKLMSKLGKQTLSIYVLQSFVIEWNIFHIPYDSLCCNRYIIPFLAVAVSILLYGVTLLIKRQKIVSLLLIGSK